MFQVKIKSQGPENGQMIDIDKSLVLLLSIAQKFVRWRGPGDKILNTAQSGSSDLLEYSSPKKISNEDSKTYQHMSVHVAGLRVESKAKEMQTKMNKESERLRRTWMLKKSYWVKGCQERQDLPPSNWTPIPYKSVQCS